MTGFWVGAALLGALMLLILVYPSLKSGSRVAATGSPRQSLQVFRDRLKELEEEKRSGVLSEEEFERIRLELEASLVEDSQQLSSASVPGTLNPRQRWVFAASLAVLVLAITVLVYGRYGAYSALEQARLAGSLMAQNPDHVTQEQIQNMVATLAQKLEENPEDLDGWFLLARSYMNLGRFRDAAEAYLKTVPLVEKQNENPAAIYGLIAQARYYANQEKLSDEVKAALDQAFALDPNEPNALGLLGLIAMQNGDYGGAVEFWGRILDAYPDHPSREAILSGIREARSRMAATTTGSEDAGKSKTAATVQLTMEVRLAPTLRAQARETDTVFIYARAVNGPRMPLAIVRKTVADLPLTITLDDSMAMAPMARLSNFDEVELIARVSRQGTPEPKPGDLEGRLSPVRTREAADAPYQIVIDRAL